MLEWIKGALVAATLITGWWATLSQAGAHDASVLSGTAILMGLTITGTVCGVIAVIPAIEKPIRAIALMGVCLVPGLYPINAALLIWGAVELRGSFRQTPSLIPVAV